MPVSVLIVDDDDAFRRLAARLLVLAGFTVAGEAATAAAAAEAGLALRFDAALVDVGLPDGDGRDVAAHLRALSWHPRIVLTSSDPDAVSDADVARCGAAAFVPKEQLPDGASRYLAIAD
jgi:DNA-binding NarL/FixJ family response regulator